MNLVNIPPGEKFAGICPVREFEEGKYVVMATRKGTIKKTELARFANIRSGGIIAMGIDEGDELIAAEITDGTRKIFLATHEGMAICFPESKLRAQGRQGYGVRGITLDEGDYVISVAAVSDDTEMLSISANGFGKRTQLSEYRVTSRGGKGVIGMKIMGEGQFRTPEQREERTGVLPPAAPEPATAPPELPGKTVASSLMYWSSSPPRHVRHRPDTALMMPMLAFGPLLGERPTTRAIWPTWRSSLPPTDAAGVSRESTLRRATSVPGSRPTSLAEVRSSRP